MAKTETQTAYEALQEKIKQELALAVELNKISNENLLAVLFLLGQTSTVLELETFVDIFSDSFPVLKTIHLEKKAHAKTDIEEKVKKVVSKMVFTDPKRASEITKAALDKNVSWDELVKKFPELGEV